MSFKHGVYKSEVPTSLVSPVEGSAGLPVFIGTAPVHLAADPVVNSPVLCHSYNEAVSYLGYSDDWEKYTLCEAMFSQFALYSQSPVIFINVLDPNVHSQKITAQKFTVQNGRINLGKDILLPLIEVASQDVDDVIDDDDNVTAKIIYQKGTDFEAAFNSDNECVLSLISTGRLANAPEAYISFRKLMPGQVSSDDIIGGVSQNGNNTGLECISDVFPKFRLVPGIIAAPGWSHIPGVAAVMRAKCENINGLFNCICVTDIPSGSNGAVNYSEVTAWKNNHSYTGIYEITCWPLVTFDGRTYHLSTHIIGALTTADANYDDTPVKSPSNTALHIDGLKNDLGSEIILAHDTANYLNSQGIVTALNFSSGWVAWGNRTAAYPGTSDVKDCFIPVRRMFNFIGNTFITTFWQEVDAPVTLRLIQMIINSFNLYLNGLAARGFILGGRIEFQDIENVTTDLLNGILRFHIYITPPIPAEVIEGIFEYDPAYLTALFS